MAFVTLHVGAGTFQPVRVDSIEEHTMHSEYAEVPQEVVDAVLAAWDEPGTPQAAPHGGYVANIQGNLAISANKRGVRLEPMAAFRARRRK